VRPYLLEVNHTPSFSTDTPLDSHIKKNLIRDTVVLMNINIQTKNEIVYLYPLNSKLGAKGADAEACLDGQEDQAVVGGESAASAPGLAVAGCLRVTEPGRL
jgi:hypothetical protein